MKYMSIQDPQFGYLGSGGAWLFCMIGMVTIQDTAWFLACLVSVGTIFLQWDKYKAQFKKKWNEWKKYFKSDA